MHSEHYLSDKDEKEIYNRHENSPDDQRYRDFLSRLFIPLTKKLKPNSAGLDFGSGSGPTLSIMLEEIGHKMSIYDKYYCDKTEVLERDYDFITSTEVIEHLKQPGLEIKRLLEILKPNGYFGIMTKFASDLDHFVSWHYKNDPTHICFYSLKTFKWIAKTYSLTFEVVGSDVIIFHRK